MPLEYRALVVGKRRCGDREVAPARRGQRVQQRLGHRPDVAGRRAVERRAVLEVDLRGALRLRASAAPAAIRRSRRAAGIVRDFSVTTTASAGTSSAVVRYADDLHDAHTGTDEIVREVGGTREVVGDAAEVELMALTAYGSRRGRDVPRRRCTAGARPQRPQARELRRAAEHERRRAPGCGPSSCAGSGPAMLTVPSTAPVFSARMAAASAVTPGSASFSASP